MAADELNRRLAEELDRWPILDPHSHIDPFRPASASLDDILGYHYYTELAHSAGMGRHLLGPDADPRERCREIIRFLERFDNTVQSAWFVEIARSFLGHDGDRVTLADADRLFDVAERLMSRPDWEAEVVRRTGLRCVFLTNSFDDPLDGFDSQFYVPCLRTDDLVFQSETSAVRERLARTTGVEVGDDASLRRAVRGLFERFTQAGARACAISLPPTFAPSPAGHTPARVFWMLAEFCREFQLPFDLMIGVNRRVYPAGVFQGQDLFDQRTSLIQYSELFNAFPEVKFPVSVLTSVQNQELVSYSWIFPNVLPHGHWWYSNIPAYIEPDLRARLMAVPKVKLLGYYSDAYKLEFVLPKFRMYRRCLARVLAEDFIRPGRLNEERALDLARRLLCDNVSDLFRLGRH